MTQLTKPMRDLHAHAEQAARDAALHAGPAITFLARAGYAAKGIVYGLIGGLALLAAFGSRGETTGSKGALRTLLDQSFGQVLLAVIAVGLAGYALWCFVRAILDPERDGNNAKGLAKRAFNFGKGIVHAALVVAVIGMIRGTGDGGGDDEGLEEWTATLMSFPLGIWLVGLAGASVIAYGARQLYRAWTTDLDDQLSLSRMGPTAHVWTIRFSRFGMAARGVVFGVIGAFLLIAAYRADPSEAKGVGEALQTLQQQPYGPVILGVVALGLISYGAYELIRARYRRIDPT
jgi:type IV secretory pathway VirB2 component (pilin)